MKRALTTVIITIVFWGCCKKDNVFDSTKKQPNTLSIRIEHYAGNKPLRLNEEWYKNEYGDSLQVTRLSYYLSNFKLVDENGIEYNEPESYHLVRFYNDHETVITINNMPPGNFKSLSFLIGVDSIRNVSGAQTGALDPVNDMFWDWSTGYVMAKLEGISPQSDQNKSFAYHLGGYKHYNSSIRKISFDNIKLVFSANKSSVVHMNADILEWFKTPNIISIKKTPYFMSPGTESMQMADNYADMFSIDRVE